MKPVKTSPSAAKTASSPDEMAKWGNAGNTKGTRLPGGGCPRGRKTAGKKSSKGY